MFIFFPKIIFFSLLLNFFFFQPFEPLVFAVVFYALFGQTPADEISVFPFAVVCVSAGVNENTFSIFFTIYPVPFIWIIKCIFIFYTCYFTLTVFFATFPFAYICYCLLFRYNGVSNFSHYLWQNSNHFTMATHLAVDPFTIILFLIQGPLELTFAMEDTVDEIAGIATFDQTVNTPTLPI